MAPNPQEAEAWERSIMLYVWAVSSLVNPFFLLASEQITSPLVWEAGMLVSTDVCQCSHCKHQTGDHANLLLEHSHTLQLSSFLFNRHLSFLSK